MKCAAEIIAEFRRLPIANLKTITNGRKVMILASHADDESLGCGGLIAELTASGQSPVVVVVTDGTGSHPSSPSYPASRLRDLREREALAAVNLLGVPGDHLNFLQVRDTAVPTSGPEFSSIVHRIEGLMDKYNSDLLCAPWLYDPHGDHEATHMIAHAAAANGGATLLSYPVWGWLLEDDLHLPDAPIVGWRLNIRKHLELKRRAISADASQYSNLIDDDPNGFRLPADLLSVFTTPYEIFLRTL